jgi:hypothetical protein
MNHQSDKTHNLLILRLPLWSLEKNGRFVVVLKELQSIG